MQFTIIIILALATLAYELPPLIKNKWWREAAAFLALLLLGVTLAISQTLDIHIPNPADAIEYIFMPVSEWVDNVLTS